MNTTHNHGLHRFAGLIAFLLVLSGCAVGPHYERPAQNVPAVFKEARLTSEAARHWKAAQPAEALARGRWWEIFNEPLLDKLEDQALAANQNLKAAAARVEQSRALQRNAKAARFPTVDAGFGPSRQRASNASLGLPDDAANSPETLWRAQLGVSYEADLFGRVASTVDAAQADTLQSTALFESLRLALQADVAQNYFLIRRLDAEQELLAHTVALRAKTLDLIEQRYQLGEISELDQARARTELSTARAQALGITRQRVAAEHGLAILLGEPPSEFSVAPAPISRVNAQIPAGLPSSLLERRPDIAAAEYAMAAANARVGAAKAAFFPRLTLTGGFGYESSGLGELFNWGSRAFLLGPLIGTALTLPIFDGGARTAQMDNARARYTEDVANYRQTVLQAFREVEDSLSGLRILTEQTAVQDQALASAERAAHLSRTQYREGSIAYLDVIDADRAVLQQQLATVRLDGERAALAVDLVRALGGGWSVQVAASK